MNNGDRIFGAGVLLFGLATYASFIAPSQPARSPTVTVTSRSANPVVSSSVTAPATSAVRTATEAERTTALAALESLVVKGRAPRTGYSRSLFGPAWDDVDANGCDTRNDILRRDLRDINPVAGCVVRTGTLQDPYTGQTISFTRGVTTSLAVQIDHVVALSDAYQKGARSFTYEKRRAIANDPLNLLAVDGPANEVKSDSDAASWLPPQKSYRCAYVARQVAVKLKYGLWVTSAERDAIARVLSTCPNQALPR